MSTGDPSPTSGHPLLIGLRAARANLVPGLIVQAAMVAVVVAYYELAPARDFFAGLAAMKARWGFSFTFVVSIIAGALLPELLKIATVQGGRPRRANLHEFFFLAIFWGVDGLIVDEFYRFQAVLFGSRIDAATVTKKVLLDQFVYNPLLAAPLGMFAYELKNTGYRLGGMGHAFTWSFYRDRTIPALFATWGIWIPVTGAIYTLPPLLQIPLFALALTFWVLMVAYITARPHAPAAHPEAPALPQAMPE